LDLPINPNFNKILLEQAKVHALSPMTNSDKANDTL